MAGPNVPTALKNRIQQAENNQQQQPPQNQPPANQQQQPPANQQQQPPANQQQQPPANQQQQPPQNAPEDRVTLSRSEVEQLREQARRGEQAGLQAERMRDQMQALEQRLTELSAPAKGSSQQEGGQQQPQNNQQQQPTELKLQYSTEPEELTAEEKKDFGESETSFVTKVATAVAAREIRTILPQIETMIQQALSEAKTAGTSVASLRRNTLKESLEQKIGERLDNFVQTAEWQEFIKQADEGSGFTHQQILSTHLDRGNIEHAARIYKKFLDSRGNQQNQQQQNGYAGANPTGAAAQTPPDSQQPQMLKYSDHKKAHQQYVKREISWDDYKKVSEEFDKAEKEGRIDFNS